MTKRGQFFLLMAFVLTTILLGLGTIYSHVRASPEDRYLLDLSEEIRFEGYNVIDNSVFQGLADSQLETNVESLLNIYAQSNPESDILAVYGDESDLKVVSYSDQVTGSIGLSAGALSPSLNHPVRQKFKRRPPWSFKGQAGGKIEVVLPGSTLGETNITYEFDLKKGQNFFLALKKQRGDEEIVVLPE